MLDVLSQAAAVFFAQRQGVLFQAAIEECLQTHTRPLDMILDQRVLRYYHTLRAEHELADAAAHKELSIARAASFLIRANVASTVAHHFLLANDTGTPKKLADEIFSEWDISKYDPDSGDDRFIAVSVVKAVYCAAIAAAHDGDFEGAERYLDNALKHVTAWEWTGFWKTLGKVHIAYAKIRAGEKLAINEAPGGLLERLRIDALASTDREGPMVGEDAQALLTLGLVTMWNGQGEIGEILKQGFIDEVVPNLRQAIVMRWEGHYSKDESQSDSFRLAAQGIENECGSVWPFYWDAHPYIL